MAIRYSGNDLYISINGVVMDSNSLSILVDESINTIDSSAGSSRASSHIRTHISAEFIIEYLETSEFPCVELHSELKIGNSVDLVYAPEGTASGNLRYSCIASVIGVYRESPPDGKTVASAILLRNGEQLEDVF